MDKYSKPSCKEKSKNWIEFKNDVYDPLLQGEMCSNFSNFHERINILLNKVYFKFKRNKVYQKMFIESYADNDRPTVSSSINVVDPLDPVLANSTSFISEPIKYHSKGL